MSRCVHVGNKRRVVCAGDLIHSITIENRAITPPVAGSVDFTETFSTSSTVLAAIQTVKGKTFFDGVNQRDQEVTHEFYVRYDAAVTAQSWVKYNNRRFDILDVEDFDERNEWMKLICTDKAARTI